MSCPDVAGEAYHRAHVLGGEQVVGDDDRTRHGVVNRLRFRVFEKVVGFYVHRRGNLGV